jgi:hypothetical protein
MKPRIRILVGLLVAALVGAARPSAAQPAAVDQTFLVTSLGDAHVWVALKSARKGIHPDVRVELLNSGVPVASGLQRCLRDLGADATELVVPWSPTPALAIHPGDVLALRVSARMGTRANGKRCEGRYNSAGVRLFYDSADRASRFAAAVTPDPSASDLYLHCDAAGCGNPADLSLSTGAPGALQPSLQDSPALSFRHGNAWAEIGTWSLPPQRECSNDLIPLVRDNPPAPAPEPIAVDELPLPPTAPSTAVGACTADVNPNGTGCLDPGIGALQSGGFLPDGHHVTARTTFAGAPSAPDPTSIYSGDQIILVKTDGTAFSNGDPWKCLTCGVPPENAMSVNSDLSYPQPFRDGMRILAGTNVVDCSPHLLADDSCTPAETHVYPLRWANKADPNGSPGNLRELRLHPDNVHLGFNHIVFSPALGEFSYFGRLSFNPAPVAGPPLVPRYDIVNVSVLFDQSPDKDSLKPDPAHPGDILFDPFARTVGELRGFTKDGKEVFYVGAPEESDNIDVASADLTTGAVRYLTRNPEYCDPLDSSPDDNWSVAMDTRGSGRTLFMGAMEGIPPINDQITVGLVASIRNNGARRFFQPYLIDRYSDRGSYQGQQLNAGDGSPGSVSDPNWNGMADPRWSPDGTAVAYWQALVTSPACGGPNPLPCPDSTEPGGRRTRMMIAHLTSRAPLSIPPVAEVSDSVPWATPFHPGDPDLVRPHLPQGTYTLRGKVFGTAVVDVTENAAHSSIAAIGATYDNYTDDGIHIINGTESASGSTVLFTTNVTWHSNLTLSGCQSGTKLTSEPGGYVAAIDLFANNVEQTGTLTTTIDGQVYTQPANGQ